MSVPILPPYLELDPHLTEPSPYSNELFNLIPSLCELVTAQAEAQNHNTRIMNAMNERKDIGGLKFFYSSKPETFDYTELRKRAYELFLSTADLSDFETRLSAGTRVGLSAVTNITGIYLSEEEILGVIESQHNGAKINYASHEAQRRARIEYDELSLRDRSRTNVLSIIVRSDETPEEYRVRIALLTVMAVPLAEDRLAGRKTPLEVLIEEAKVGLIDIELYDAFRASEEFTKLVPALAALTSFVILVANNQIPPVTSEEAINSLKRSLSGLPATAKQDIYKMRTTAVGQLTKILNNVRASGVPSRVSRPDIAQNLFSKAYQNVILSVARNSVDPKRGTLIDQARSRNRKDIETLDSDQKLPSQNVAPLINREVHAVKSTANGYEIAAKTGGDGLDRLLNDFCSEFHNDSLLLADLKSIKKFLSTIDFSHGKVNGVKQYKYGIHLDDQIVNVFGLKPQTIPEISNTSKRMHQIRVLFSLNSDGNIAVIGVFERNKLADWERRQSLGSNRRG